MQEIDPRHTRYMKNRRAAELIVSAAEKKELDEVIASVPEKKTAGLPVCSSLSVELMELAESRSDAAGNPSWEGACPACRAAGADSAGDNFRLYSDGAWSCAAFLGAAGSEHRSQIRKIVGAPRGGQTGPRVHPLMLRLQAAEREATAASRSQDLIACREVWREIVAFGDDHAGQSAAVCIREMLGDGGAVPAFGLPSFRYFCSWFLVGEIAWCGEMECKRDRFKSRIFEPASPLSVLKRWERLESEANLSDLCFLASFKPTAEGRDAEGVARIAGGVIEHDGLKDARTQAWHQVALLAWLRDAAGLDLRAVVGTGGKGVHGWLDEGALSAMLIIPGASRPLPLVDFLRFIGADAQAFSRAATRLPGVLRGGDGSRQEILWVSEKNCLAEKTVGA